MNFLAKLTASRSAVTDALGEVDLIREQVAEARSELRRISAAPQPEAEALAAFDAWAERQATDAVDRLRVGRLLEPGAAAAGLSLPHVVTRIAGEPVGNHTHVDDMLLGLIIATSLPALREIVRGQLTDRLAGREPLTSDQRAARMAEAEAALLSLELTEEACIRGLEAAGVPCARRADADPRAVLCADASLPS